MQARIGTVPIVEWLQLRYPKIIAKRNTLSSKIDCLCVDISELIRMTAQRLQRSESKRNMDRSLSKGVLAHLDTIVRGLSPGRKLFVAFDGVEPALRTNFMRGELYKASERTRVVDEIKTRHRMVIDADPGWDANELIPGTPTVGTIYNRVLAHVSSSPVYAMLETSIGSTTNAGNASSKIARFLRAHKHLAAAVYGYDRELVHRVMLLGDVVKNVTLVIPHEAQRGDSFQCITVLKLRNCLGWELNTRLSSKCSTQVWVNDYVALSLLLRNCSIGASPSLGDHSLERALVAYRESVQKHDKPLTRGATVDIDVMTTLLGVLAEEEEEELMRLSSVVDSQPPSSANPYRCDVWAYDNLYPKAQSAVVFGAPGWEDTYYTVYMSADDSEVSGLSQKWWHGYTMHLQYLHFPETTNWDWYYPARRAPLLGDLGAALSSDQINKFPESAASTPPSVFCQLLEIIPGSSVDVLPYAIQPLVQRLGWMFPSRFATDETLARDRFVAPPLLPFVDRDAVVDALRVLVYDPSEEKLNLSHKHFQLIRRNKASGETRSRR